MTQTNPAWLDWTLEAIESDERTATIESLQDAARPWLDTHSEQGSFNYVTNLPVGYMAYITSHESPKTAFVDIVANAVVAACESPATDYCQPARPTTSEQLTAHCLKWGHRIVSGYLGEIHATEHVAQELGYTPIPASEAVEKFDRFDVPEGKDADKVLDKKYGIDIITACGVSFQVKSSRKSLDSINADYLIVADGGDIEVIEA
jgi:hypothetical protein